MPFEKDSLVVVVITAIFEAPKGAAPIMESKIPVKMYNITIGY